jgi:hypothetical protein
MPRLPLTSTDAADRAQFLKLFVWLFGPAYVILGAAEVFAFVKEWIGPATLVLLLLANVPVLFLLALVLSASLERAANGIANTLYAGGNLPPSPAHSGMDSLVARGLYREAAGAYSAHLVRHPQDNLARIKLAQVHRDHLGEPEVAERLLQEVRRNRPKPRDEFMAANLLIELHRSTGRRDRLMVELARFADRYKGTRAGRDAARALKEMKQADA